MGGIGNQLFQYSAGQALALKHNTALKLDLSFLNADPNNLHTKRSLELDAFHLDYKIANESDLKVYKQKGLFSKLVKRFFPFLSNKHRLVNESQFNFNSDFFSYPKNVYLNGFWQSEKYFKNIREVLLKEIVIRDEMTAQCKEMRDKILNSDSVSLHIRRGDYITNKNANSFHGVLSMEYYSKAIDLLSKEFKDLTFFIFSDDMDWVKSNFKIQNKIEYIDFTAGEKNCFDLYLMSLCKHNIIANSSFSWWGAWLNKNENKKVIAPNRWFLSKDVNTSDLIPDTWIKL
jgi:hypothetical protein